MFDQDNLLNIQLYVMYYLPPYWPQILIVNIQIINIIMLIQKQKPTNFQTIKIQIYDTFSLLLQQTYKDSQNVFFIFIIQKILQIILEFSIIFQPQINKIWQSNSVNITIKFFSLFNPVAYINGSMQIYMILLLLVFGLLTISVMNFLLIMFKVIQKNIFLRMTMILIRILKIIAIPIFQILIYSLNNNNSLSNIAIKFLNIFYAVLATILLGTYTKFYFCPFRKDNIYHKINTDFQVYQFMSIILKLIFIHCYNINIGIIILFLLLEIAKSIFVKSTFQIFVVKTLNKLACSLNIILFIVILLNIFLNNDQSLYYFWLFSNLIVILMVISKILFINILTIDLDDCNDVTQQKIVNFLQINQKMVETNQQNYFYFYFAFVINHTDKCNKQNCYLKLNKKKMFPELEITQGFSRKNVGQHIKLYLIEILQQNSQKSEQFSVLYFLMLYEEQKVDNLINLRRKTQNLGYDFIIYNLKKITSKQQSNNEYQVTDQNYYQSKMKFFKQFELVIKQLKIFMNQLKQKKTRLQIVEEKGYQIYLQIQNLKSLFNKIIKTDRLDFKIIEFYMEFILNLLKQQLIIDQLIQKIKKKSALKYEDYNLQNTPTPTFQLNLLQSKIQNVNMEAIKIFNYHKIQMMQKKIQTFIIPQLPQSDIDFTRVFKLLLSDNLYCFGKNRKSQIFVLKLKARSRLFTNVKKNFLQLHPIKKLKNQAYIMINQNFEPILYSQNQLKISNNQQPLKLEQIFQSLIKPNILQLQRNHKIQLQYTQKLPNQITLLKTINPQISIIKLKVKLTEKKNNYKIRQIVQPKLFFTYQFKTQNQKGGYIGVRQKIQHFSTFIQLNKNQQINTQVISITQPIKSNYSKGIKSYRIDGEILINIELEDKQINFQTFVNEKQSYQKKQYQKKFTIAIKIITIFCLIILIAYLFVTVSFTINKFTYINSLNYSYTTFNMIEAYQLKFYRLLAILRDSLLFPAADWTTPMLETFYDLLYSQNMKIFLNTLYTIKYNNQTFTMDLGNLCNILITMIFKMAKQKNNYLAISTNSIGTTTLASAITIQKQVAKQGVYDLLNNIVNVTSNLFGLYILLSGLLILLVIAVDYLQILKRKQLLINFRNMSDYQIQSYIERLQKFEFLLSLNQKNQEMEVLGSLEDKKQYPKRQYPKDYKAKLIKNKVSIFVIIMLFVILIIIFIYMFIFTGEYVSQSLLQLDTNAKISNIYVQFLYLSINTTKKIDQNIYNEMFNSLEFLQMTRQTYPYGQNFTNFLDNILFRNSCNILPDYLQNFSCRGYKFNISYRKPFSQGLIYYLHGAHFALNQNISQTIISTGIYGKPFYQIFSIILNQTQREWYEKNKSIMNYESSFLILNVLGLILLIILFWISFQDNKMKQKQIRLIVRTFMSSSCIINLKKDNKQLQYSQVSGN